MATKKIATPSKYEGTGTDVGTSDNKSEHENHLDDGINLITPIRTSEGSVKVDDKDEKAYPEGPHAAGIQAIVNKDEKPGEPNEREKAEAEQAASDEKQRQANIKEAEKNIKPARRIENGVLIDEAVQT